MAGNIFFKGNESIAIPRVEKMIYLDVEFISLKYEESSKSPANTVMTKIESVKAGMGFQLLNAGIHTQESRSYNISSFMMLKEVYSELLNYPMLNFIDYNNGSDSSTGWIHGVFTFGSWRDPKQDNDIYKIFEFHADNSESSVSFLSNNEYFYPGISQIADTSPALQLNINIPSKALVRILYHADAAKSFVAVPLLIHE